MRHTGAKILVETSERLDCYCRNERKLIMDLGLGNKVALVLAGGGGLGSAIAKALAREGAKLAIADINAEALAKSEKEIKVAGANVLTLTWDLTNLDHIERNVHTVEERYGAVDVLVNITGGPTSNSGRRSECGFMG